MGSEAKKQRYKIRQEVKGGNLLLIFSFKSLLSFVVLSPMPSPSEIEDKITPMHLNLIRSSHKVGASYLRFPLPSA